MILSGRLAGPGLALLALSACHHEPPPPPAAQVPAVMINPRENLNRLLDRYWESYLALNPTHATAVGDPRFNAHLEDTTSLTYLADSLALERDALAELKSLPPDRLDAADRLSYEIFKAGRESEIRGYVFPAELLPVNQIGGMPQSFAQMGSGAGIQPFASAKDYEDWLSRIEDFVTWKDHAIAAMREGVRRGYTLPRVIVQHALPTLSMLSQDRADNPFYGPLRNFPQALNAADRARLGPRLEAAIKTRILPAYRDLYDFLRNEYMPVARTSSGLSSLPMGEDWYAYLVKRETSTSMTPAQVHQLGLAEVERLRERLLNAVSQLGFSANLNEFFGFVARDPRFYFASEDELLNAYRELKPQVLASAPNLFAVVPNAEFDIRAVEGYRRSSAAAASFDRAAADAKRPGILYINTSDLPGRPRFAVPSLFLQAAVPGRFLQRTVQLERTDLPRFRRFGDAAAFQQGWSLYAAGLGDDLGVYTDPYARTGALMDELRRALRLVVDTGINARGWTRQQGIDYLRAQIPVSESGAVADVERYMAAPAEALACIVGAMKIRAIRNHAQAVLGSRFDIRAFHSELLKDGSMPLDLLEAKMDRWNKTALAGPPAQAPLQSPAPARPAPGP